MENLDPVKQPETALGSLKKPVRGLSKRAQSFLHHLAAGRPTLEAYSLSGYKGEPHAAYQLRSDLKQHLAALLEQGGFSREALASEVNRLNELPLDPNIKNVNFKQKLDLLRLMDKALPKQLPSGERPKITPFKLTFGGEQPKLTSIEGEIVGDSDVPSEEA